MQKSLLCFVFLIGLLWLILYPFLTVTLDISYSHQAAGLPSDVVIVGAGFSGLVAAYELLKRNPGLRLRVTLLDALPRVGGRTYSVWLPANNKGQKDRWDIGGMWVFPQQTELLTLIEEFEVGVYEQYDAQLLRAFMNSQGTIVAPDPALLHKLNQNDLPNTTCNPLMLLDKVKLTDLSKFKYVSVGDWLRFTKVPCELEMANLMYQHFETDMDKISMSFLITYLKAQGTELPYGSFRINVTAGGFAERIAQHISRYRGAEVLLNHTVTSVVQRNNSVDIHTTNGKTFLAKQVVLAIPPSQVAKILFIPALPTTKTALLREFKSRSLGIKIVATFKTPFWRQRNVSQIDVRLCYDMNCSALHFPRHYFFHVFDDASSTNSPALAIFLRRNTAKQSHKAEVLRTLYKILGIQVYTELLGYAEKDWRQEKFIEGCVATVSRGTNMEIFDTNTRESVGLIHWAGTETATRWMGFMAGAVEAGFRAASEVLVPFLLANTLDGS